MKKFIIIIYFIAVPLISIGQPTPPGDPGDEPIPITGIEILLAAGGLFGAKKIYDNSRKEK